jgi:DNA-binding transcriptional ArsR family regulator
MLAGSNGNGGVLTTEGRKQLSEAGAKIVQAYGHPIRARAMMILGSRVASPKEIAEELGEPIGKVSYHVRELRDSGLIELVETDDRHGGIQHFYRATRLAILDYEGMAAQDSAERAASSSVVLNLMFADLAKAVAEGTLDSRAERVLIRHHMLLDQQGLRELSDLYTDTLYEAIRLQKESRARLDDSGEEGIPMTMQNLIFEMPDADLVALDSTLEWLDGEEGVPDSGRRKKRRADDRGSGG